jgi:hypothetical protein
MGDKEFEEYLDDNDVDPVSCQKTLLLNIVNKKCDLTKDLFKYVTDILYRDDSFISGVMLSKIETLQNDLYQRIASCYENFDFLILSIIKEMELEEENDDDDPIVGPND